MKRKSVSKIAVLLSAVIVSLSACSYSVALRANWGFSLPNGAGCSEIYSANSGASFHGDGVRYHIFSYESEDSVEKMFAWSSAESEMLHHASYSKAVEEWLGEINVSDEYWPNIEECVYHYERQDDHSEIIVFWNSGENRLYVLESFL